MSRRIGVRFAVLALAGLACACDRRSASVRGGADSVALSVAPAASAGRDTIPSTWHIVSWEAHAGVDPTDLGIGVVFLRRAEDKSGTIGTDTLILRSAADPTSPPAGAMFFVVSANGVTSYQIATPDSVTPNLVEYGYEESGVPFDSSDASGRWLHALLGSAPDGTMRAGWVDTSQAGVGTVRWADQLRDAMIYFPTPDRAAFFATPDSSTPLPAPRSRDDYALHPIVVRGPWMQARLVTPSDNCVEPDSAPRRTRQVWLRYLDDRGRPNVWYYTRGC